MIGRLLLNLAILVVPPGLSLLGLFVVGSELQFETNFQNVVLSALLGFGLSAWLFVYLNSTSLRVLRDAVVNEKSSRFRIIRSQRELEHVVRSMYHMQDAVIYATSVNYMPQDVRISDSRKSDWGKDLYSKKNIRVQYNRIVSVYDDRDKEWVQNMIAQKKNPNYDLRVIEGVPSELLFPNFVIVKQNDWYHLFMSYRANFPEGRFAFITEAREIGEGLWSYASGFHGSLPKAEDCLDRWGQEGSVEQQHAAHGTSRRS